MPDIFVATDTTNMNSYVTAVYNAGLLHKFAFEYVDAHRAELDKATSSDEVIASLPSDAALLNEFVQYAAFKGVPARWYYINNSRPLLVNNLKALIARDALGSAAYYEIANTRDNVVQRAIEFINNPKK